MRCFKIYLISFLRRKEYQKILIFIFLISCLLVQGCASRREWIAGRVEEDRVTLNKIYTWMVVEGLAEFYRTGDVEHFNRYVEEELDGNNNLWPPFINLPADWKQEDYAGYIKLRMGGWKSLEEYNEKFPLHRNRDYETRFITKMEFLTDDTSLFFRVEKDYIYEYWIVRRYPRYTDIPQVREMFFILARTKSLKEDREIVKSSNKYFTEYRAPDGTVIDTTLKKKYFRDIAYHWLYKEAFEGTEYENVRVYYDSRKKKYIKESLENLIWLPAEWKFVPKDQHK